MTQVPPELMQLLAGGGGAPPAGMPMQGMPAEEEPAEDTISILEQMIELAKRYIEVEQDPEDRFTMSDILKKLMQYEADEQKEQDAAVGASPAVKFLRRRNA